MLCHLITPGWEESWGLARGRGAGREKSPSGEFPALPKAGGGEQRFGEGSVRSGAHTSSVQASESSTMDTPGNEVMDLSLGDGWWGQGSGTFGDGLRAAQPQHPQLLAQGTSDNGMALKTFVSGTCCSCFLCTFLRMAVNELKVDIWCGFGRGALPTIPSFHHGTAGPRAWPAGSPAHLSWVLGFMRMFPGINARLPLIVPFISIPELLFALQ